MKREIPTAFAVAVIIALLIAAGAIYWRGWTRQEQATIRPPSGPIQLPPSQQGTRLGNQVLGSQLGAPTPPPPQAGR